MCLTSVQDLLVKGLVSPPNIGTPVETKPRECLLAGKLLVEKSAVPSTFRAAVSDEDLELLSGTKTSRERVSSPKGSSSHSPSKAEIRSGCGSRLGVPSGLDQKVELLKLEASSRLPAPAGRLGVSCAGRLVPHLLGWGLKLSRSSRVCATRCSASPLRSVFVWPISGQVQFSFVRAEMFNSEGTPQKISPWKYPISLLGNVNAGLFTAKMHSM